MKISTLQIQIVLVVAVAADMLVFAKASGMTLIGIVTGGATVLLGMTFSYRPASAIGVIIICATGAAAIQISTLTEVGTLITAAFGLVIPVIVLTLVSLSAEREEAASIILRKRPILRAAGYAVACLFAVPITVLLISFVAPGVSTRVATMTEAAILLVVTIGAGTALTWREPRASLAENEE